MVTGAQIKWNKVKSAQWLSLTNKTIRKKIQKDLTMTDTDTDIHRRIAYMVKRK